MSAQTVPETLVPHHTSALPVGAIPRGDRAERHATHDLVAQSQKGHNVLHRAPYPQGIFGRSLPEPARDRRQGRRVRR